MQPLLPVQSSMLSHLGYDPASRVLAVRFKNSSFVHHHRDVPPEVAAQLTHLPPTESIGRAFNNHVRGRYDVTQIPVEDEATSTAPLD